MRGVWLLVVAGCSFHPSDGPPPGDDDASLPRDAPADTTHGVTIDGPPPDAYRCSSIGFTCPSVSMRTVISTVCNGGCWIACISDTPMPVESLVVGLCHDWGGRLAPIRTLADQGCIATTLLPSQASWIGFEQAPAEAATTGGWSWNSDGLTPAFTNWDSGQPNDGDGSENGAEQCSMMNTSGKWDDVDCNNNALYRFSCRHD